MVDKKHKEGKRPNKRKKDNDRKSRRKGLYS